MEKGGKNFLNYLHVVNYRDAYRNWITSDSFVAIENRRTESLDGMWNFTVDQYDTCLHAKWYRDEHEKNGYLIPVDFDFEGWERVIVPGCWNMAKPDYLLYEGVGIYTRTFTYKPEIPDERVFLWFGGVQYEATIFLNGVYLGSHRGGSTSFSVEISDHLEKENRILVVVDNTRRDDRVPMSSMDWFNYGGIYRSVSLLRLPKRFIRNYKIQLVPDRTYSTIRCEVWLDDPSANGTGHVTIEELEIARDFEVWQGLAEFDISCEPMLWSFDNPKLYNIILTYGEDVVSDLIGFREIRRVKSAVILNGKEVYCKGISCHEDSSTGGKTLSEEEILLDLKHAKELNCNYVRLAHYPHSQRVAQLADRLGLMLWEEIPMYWAIAFANNDTYADAQNQLDELIFRDWNRASVIIWSVGNENLDTDERFTFMSNLIDRARALDSTRLIAAACLVNHVENKIEDRLSKKLDIIGINEYYGWYEPEYEMLPQMFEHSKVDKPVFISEFGGGALSGHRGSISDFFTEDRQWYIYKRQLETLERIPYVRGLSPWILNDFRSPRRTNRYQRGYNRKGLYAEDKKTRKLAYDVLKAYYENH